MNDFTKEELWFINEHLKNSINCNHVINPRLVMPILNKIQSMIDDYCRHDRPYTIAGSTVCLDCNEIIKNPDYIKLDN